MDEKTRHMLNVSTDIYNDTLDWAKQIESKLHNFSYIWIAFCMSMISLFFKSCNTYTEYNIKFISYLIFFVYETLGILLVTYHFFKVYVYNGKYMVNNNIKGYKTLYLDVNTDLNSFVIKEINALEISINNNSNINNIRLTNLDKTKKYFKWFLGIKIILIFILNLTNYIQ